MKNLVNSKFSLITQIFLLILLNLSLLSCQLGWNTKPEETSPPYHFSGLVTDKVGQPLANCGVSLIKMQRSLDITTFLTSFKALVEADLLSFTISRENGYYEITWSSPSGIDKSSTYYLVFEENLKKETNQEINYEEYPHKVEVTNLMEVSLGNIPVDYSFAYSGALLTGTFNTEESDQSTQEALSTWSEPKPELSEPSSKQENEAQEKNKNLKNTEDLLNLLGSPDKKDSFVSSEGINSQKWWYYELGECFLIENDQIKQTFHFQSFSKKSP